MAPRLMVTSMSPRKPVTKADPANTCQSGLAAMRSVAAGGTMKTVSTSSCMPSTKAMRLWSMVAERR
jgi:hypothetical protein